MDLRNVNEEDSPEERDERLWCIEVVVALIAIVILVCITGCGASVHTGKQTTLAAPPAKTTKTVTVTEKTEQVVPVTQTIVTVKSNTQTVDSTGKLVPNALHKAEIIDPGK